MRLNSGQPASERREGVKPRLALIGGVEAGATIADIQTTAATEQLLPLNPANRRIRTRTYGGVGGEESQGSPLSRFKPKVLCRPLPATSEIVRLLRKTGSDWRKIKVTRLTLAA